VPSESSRAPNHDPVRHICHASSADPPRLLRQIRHDMFGRSATTRTWASARQILDAALSRLAITPSGLPAVNDP
jgi:hypothetical protein